MKSDELEFQQIFNDYQPKIFRYLTRLVGQFEAEDLTQEVFIKIESGLKNFRGDSKLSTWIYRIATNTAVDRMRKPEYKYKGYDSISSDFEDNYSDQGHKKSFVKEENESADQQIVKKEMNSCIRNFIENLDENYRSVLMLSEIEGLKNKEIAEILNVSLNTVKIRLHRARTQLRKKLENNCSFYRDEQNELSCDLKDENKR